MPLLSRVFRDNRPTDIFREIKKDDIVEFLCDGRGRGGHHRVMIKVEKVNPKTIQGVEQNRSYNPGTPWRIHQETDMYIHEKSLEWKAKYGDPEFKEGDEVTVDSTHLYHAKRHGKVIGKLESGEYEIQFYRQKGAVGPQHLSKK